MKIRVTRDHISRGWRNNDLDCPVALAMDGAGLRCSVVTNSRAYFYFANKKYDTFGHMESIPLPLIARVAIWIYDVCGLMIPFSFNIPDQQSETE